MGIRKLKNEDREQIKLILESTRVFNEDEIKIALELVDIYLNSPDQKDYELYSYVNDDGKVFGYYCIGPTPATDGTFDLYWIAVNPDLHGKGIGKQLLAHAEGLISSRAGRLIIAETSSRDDYFKTRQFYLRTGYSELARIKDFYRAGDDIVIYGKYLN
jgi:aminoglycoside 6'-N-acetyltransferase I